MKFKNKTYTICKKAFVSIYEIRKSKGYYALKKESEGGATIKGKRGKIPNNRQSQNT